MTCSDVPTGPMSEGVSDYPRRYTFGLGPHGGFVHGSGVGTALTDTSKVVGGGSRRPTFRSKGPLSQ